MAERVEDRLTVVENMLKYEEQERVEWSKTHNTQAVLTVANIFWAREIETDRYWLWIVVAWLGYDAGRRIAQKLINQDDGTEE